MRIVSEDGSPKSVDRVISFDWNLDSLVSEIESIVKNLHVFKRFPREFDMPLSQDEEDEDDFQIGKLFAYDDDKYEVINDNKTLIEKEISNQVSALETKILQETETFRSAISKVEEYREARKQVERRLDRQYKRKVAESLETHLAFQERARQENSLPQETIRAEEEACSDLRLEKLRLKKLRELEATNQWLKSLSNKDFSSFEKRIARVVRQIRGTKDNVIAKASEIIRIFEDPLCPLSISIEAFAKKMVSASRNPFASSYIIVDVTSKFPQAMDILLAEFHKACVYTVPRNDDDDTATNSSDYYERLDSVMRLYGALVQTDVCENIHGIEHGWAWLARFLDKTKVYNLATATAFNAFLQTAGFGLHQKYKSQFLKAANVVREHLLAMFMAERDDLADLQMIITNITAYLDYQMYLNEPQGRTMETHLLSKEFNAQVDQQNNNHEMTLPTPSRLRSLL
ncbi:unnamed protein product [Microthlaspi erraticum]|uniref:mRNA export factor GLE1 n=1 Tax=Microthlaspi erraticum TaxID=1685480 RepID=A0A6D2J1Y1_9BRAS|nr:unnamed protein product [Microthlaspi erraticum]